MRRARARKTASAETTSGELSVMLIRAAALWPDLADILEAAESEIARLRLTEKERKAIKNACKLGTFSDEIATIKGFLDRTS